LSAALLEELPYKDGTPQDGVIGRQLVDS
jgi:hypothetical protein